MSELAAWAGDVVSILALVVSVMALRKSTQAQREANLAQKRIVEIEEAREKDRLVETKRAEIRAALRKTGSSSYRIYIINDGQAGARNIVAMMDGKPYREHRGAMREFDVPATLGPNSEASLPIGIHSGCVPPFDLRITWDDDSGTGREYHTTLTF
jgi:hypothetical protein